jgi:platelet-activating factor acetylhydrolase
MPISKVIILDPWLDPLPTPGPAPYAPSGKLHEVLPSVEAPVQLSLGGVAHPHDSELSLKTPLKGHPKMFVINSEGFTLWKDHYARLQEIMATWEPQGRRIATISKTCFMLRHTLTSDSTFSWKQTHFFLGLLYPSYPR